MPPAETPHNHSPESAIDTPISAYLAELHRKAGCPSSRTMAYAIGGIASHSAVYGIISGHSQGRWPTVAAIVRYLDGDVDHAHKLWKARSIAEAQARWATRHGSPPPADSAPLQQIADQLATISSQLDEILRHLDKQENTP